MKTKVLLLSPIPPPVGGIASWTLNILDYIEKYKIEDVYHQNTAIKLRKITSKGRTKRILSGIFDSIRIVFDLIVNLAKYTPKSVHLTTSGSFALIKDLLIVLLCRLLNVPIIIHFRFGRIPELFALNNWEWDLLCKVIKLSNFTIVIDKRSFLVLEKILPSHKIDLVPNPCSLDVEEIAKKEPQIYKRNEFIFVGHIIKSKGVIELVHAIAILEEDIKLYLIGPVESSIKDKLKEIAITKKNGTWLFFEGVKNKNEILDLMQVSHGLIFPSHTEGFPNVVLEAMACGCPIIATDVGAIPEMLDPIGTNPAGLCVPAKNINELKIAIQKLSKDEQLRENLAINGKSKILGNYTMKVIFRKYQKIWFNLNKKISI